MKLSYAILSIVLGTFILPFSSFAQGGDLCKIMEMEQLHAKNKLTFKSAVQTSRYDVNYYRLDLNLDPNVRFIEGNVTTYFTTLDSNVNSIVFDFSNQLVVDSVKYHGNTVPFSTSGFKIVEGTLPSPLPINTLDSITVYYKGSPNGSATFAPFARVNIPGGDLIWTLSEPYGAQEWWPCKNDLTDKADSISIWVTTPNSYKVAANGLLQTITPSGANHTYKYKTTYPTVAYLVALGVGDYDFYQNKFPLNGDSLLMEHYLYNNQTQAQSDSGILPFLQFFDSLFGEYPFIKEKYGHASFTFGGGMEHQTISFMGSYGGELKAHELAHQWFGNKITCGSWSDLWLNEGFATYLTGLTYDFDVFHSRAFWDIWLRNTENGGLSYPNGSVYRYGNDTTVVGVLFNGQVYNKGAITLHTLRWKIGDSAFFAGTRNYITDPSLAYSFAKTPDLQQHFEIASGQNLNEFFNDWIYGAGYPQFNSYWTQNGSQFSLTVDQSPSDASVSFFEIPVPYRLIGNNWDTIIVVEPSTNIQTFNFPINQTINSIEFDPRNDIFAKELLTTGLNTQSSIDNYIKLYPNPAKEMLKISYPPHLKMIDMSIYDMQGKLVLQPALDQISIENLKSGIYVVILNSSHGIYQKKFQKVN